jgi:hypothetical protein
MSLEKLVEAKRLKKEETSVDEIRGLAGVVRFDLRVPDASLDR